MVYCTESALSRTGNIFYLAARTGILCQSVDVLKEYQNCSVKFTSMRDKALKAWALFQNLDRTEIYKVYSSKFWTKKEAMIIYVHSEKYFPSVRLVGNLLIFFTCQEA